MGGQRIEKEKMEYQDRQAPTDSGANHMPSQQVLVI